MVSVCLPSDALLQHLPSYLGFSYLGHGVSLHGCSSKAQPMLLTLDEGYLLTAALPDLQRRIAPLGPPTPRPRSGAEAGRTPCPKGGGQEELPQVGGQGQRPRVPDCEGAETAERSYPASEVRAGSQEELPNVRGQGQWPRVPGCDGTGAA